MFLLKKLLFSTYKTKIVMHWCGIVWITNVMSFEFSFCLKRWYPLSNASYSFITLVWILLPCKQNIPQCLFCLLNKHELSNEQEQKTKAAIMLILYDSQPFINHYFVQFIHAHTGINRWIWRRSNDIVLTMRRPDDDFFTFIFNHFGVQRFVKSRKT